VENTGKDPTEVGRNVKGWRIGARRVRVGKVKWNQIGAKKPRKEEKDGNE